MSKQSNVNPDQYTQAGRERQGEDILQEQHKRNFKQNEMADKNSDAAGKSNFIPGAAPVGESKSDSLLPNDEKSES